MDRTLRWAIGVVATLGAMVIVYAGAMTGDSLPHGTAPLYLLAAAFAVGAAFCFWPRPRVRSTYAEQVQKEQASPVTSTNGESEVAGIAPGRVRAFAIFMLVNGAFVAVLPLFGLTLRRFADAPPIVVTCAGLVVIVIGAVALAFSFNKRSAQAGVQTAKIVLCTIIALFVLAPIVAVLATLFGD